MKRSKASSRDSFMGRDSCHNRAIQPQTHSPTDSVLRRTLFWISTVPLFPRPVDLLVLACIPCQGVFLSTGLKLTSPLTSSLYISACTRGSSEGPGAALTKWEHA